MNRDRILIALALCFINFGFTQDYKLLRVASLSINIPSTWEELKSGGIDSEVYRYITENGARINIEYGLYNAPLDDAVPVDSLHRKEELKIAGFSTENRFFSKDPSLDKHQGTFLREYYYYEKVNDLEFKVQVPKKAGDGFTSMYMELDEKMKFSIYGHNLPKEDQESLLEVFQTIRVSW